MHGRELFMGVMGWGSTSTAGTMLILVCYGGPQSDLLPKCCGLSQMPATSPTPAHQCSHKLDAFCEQ